MRRNGYDKKPSRNKTLKKGYERELLTLVKKISFQSLSKKIKAEQILSDFLLDRASINAFSKSRVGVKTSIAKDKNVELMGLFNSVKAQLEKLKKEQTK